MSTKRRWRRDCGATVTYHRTGSRTGFGGVVLEFSGSFEWSTWRPGGLARPTRGALTLEEAKHRVERVLSRSARRASKKGRAK
jgi:hypothetical protein